MENQSIEESINRIEEASILFKDAWLRNDLTRAGRVSSKAMEQLDHVVNEIMRARDTKKTEGTYDNSNLKNELDRNQGLVFNQATREQQEAMVNRGPGNGILPEAGVAIPLVRLLNKVKHRHHQSSNFRIENNEHHIFVINADWQNGDPDSIVEFNVLNFCAHCRRIIPLI